MSDRHVKRGSILVIEDDRDIRELIEYNLSREGYRIKVASNGEDGLRRAKRDAPDLVVLDLMLPGMDGIEVCRRLKQDPVTRGIAVVMVTAKSEESDIVLGLGVGADDYVPKPFSPRTLLARVEAVLRRGPLKDDRGTAERVVRGDLVVDAGRHEVTIGSDRIDFTPTEFRLLHFLASHPGRVFSRGELLSRVIGETAVVLDRNIDVHVRAIRQKLGEHRELIQTVRSVGYRFRD
ncbi:MAG: response regulator transcription factor [Planctomycetota bacterium]